MGRQYKVWKKQPTKDGRNAKQCRADKKRAERLASAPHLNHVWTSLRNKKLHQSNRWVTHNMKTGDILGYQNEIRWGLKTGMTHLLSDEAQSSVERLDRERKAALDRLNRAKKAANPGAEKEVFGEAKGEGVGTDAAGAGAGVIVGAQPVDEDSEGVEGVEIDLSSEDEDGKDADGGEVLDDSDCMSGVEMG